MLEDCLLVDDADDAGQHGRGCTTHRDYLLRQLFKVHGRDFIQNAGGGARLFRAKETSGVFSRGVSDLLTFRLVASSSLILVDALHRS